MFRFTIRDVLWLMVVVALAVGWWINWYRWTDANETLRDETTDLRAANFKLGFELVAARSYPHENCMSRGKSRPYLPMRLARCCSR